MGKLKKYYEKRHEAFQYASWIWRKMKPSFWLICGLSLMGGLFSVINIGAAQMNKWLIDAATGNSPYFNATIFLAICLVTFLSLILNAGLGIYQKFIYEKFSFRMRKQFYASILKGDWQALSAFHSGDIMTRITSDIDTVSNGIFGFIPQLVSMISQFIMAFLLFYHYDPALALAILIFSPIGLLSSVALSRIYAKFQKESSKNESEYRSFMQESAENVMIAKCFSLEAFFQEKLEDFWQKRFHIIKKRSYISLFISIANTLVFSGSYLIAFGWSAYRLSKGEITYGTLTLMLTLISRVQSPLHSFQGLVQQHVSVLVSAGRIMEISDLPMEPETEAETIHAPVGICADHLSFTYDKGSVSVLKNICLDIKPGEIVGIVGESGAGKTTFIRLMLALMKPNSGKFCLYENQGKAIEISKSTRRLFNYVPQGNTLLSGTIRENLLLGKQDASEDEIWKALQIAEAANFVKSFPSGLDTCIREKGQTISEGQAQRLAIARAVIKPGSILILDEATASLDIETEAKIIKNLKVMASGLTCIVVTHRLTFLDICEKVYRLEHGTLRFQVPGLNEIDNP